MANKIKARIIDEKTGLLTYERVKAVRIKSDKYGVLIMEDYLPSLGNVHGKVSILTDDDEFVFDNIDGFYKCQHNIFTLLIRSTFEKEGNV